MEDKIHTNRIPCISVYTCAQMHNIHCSTHTQINRDVDPVDPTLMKHLSLEHI